MRSALANALLAKVTGWPPKKLSGEIQDLQLLSDYKYDEYQQFSPGMRFIESLSMWLDQFGEEEKDLAYELVKKRLIFASSAELHHLIRMAYPDCIRPYLRDIISEDAGIDSFRVVKIAESPEFRDLHRKCLFLGLSDGARMDLFRRFSRIKHERAYPAYQISAGKAAEMLKDLNGGNSGGSDRFSIVFLIDDFSASGKSYLRKEQDGKFHGKIQKFLDQLDKNGDDSIRHIFANELRVCVVLYSATERAKKRIREAADEFIKSKKKRVDLLIVQEIGDSTELDDASLGPLSPVLRDRFDRSVIDKHYRKGKHDNPHLGFDECGLPLVLSHNCPNNSLPMIWHESDRCRALFPRIKRHAV